MADHVYNIAKTNWLNGTLDLSADDIRVALLEANSDVTPDEDTLAAVFANAGTTELATYTRDTLTGKLVTEEDGNDRAIFNADDAQFTSVVAQNDVVAALIYKHVDGTDDNDYPIAHIDSGFPITPNGSDITITWDSAGIIALT